MGYRHFWTKFMLYNNVVVNCWGSLLFQKKCWTPLTLERLHEVWFYSIFHEHSKGTRYTKIFCSDWLTVHITCNNYTSQPLPHVAEVGRQSQDGHYFTGYCDVELCLSRFACVAMKSLVERGGPEGSQKRQNRTYQNRMAFYFFVWKCKPHKNSAKISIKLQNW